VIEVWISEVEFEGDAEGEVEVVFCAARRDERERRRREDLARENMCEEASRRILRSIENERGEVKQCPN